MPKVSTLAESEQLHDRTYAPLLPDLDDRYTQILVMALKAIDPGKVYVWVAEYSCDYESGGVIDVCASQESAIDAVRQWHQDNEYGDRFSIEQVEVKS